MHLIIIRGVFGSGKSTVGKLLREKWERTALLCSDYFYWHVSGRTYSRDLVYGALARLIDLYLSQGYNVIVEGGLSRGIDEFIEIGKKYNANIKTFYLMVTLETAFKRDKEREIHVGEEEIKRYYEKSLAAKHDKDIVLDNNGSTEEIISKIMGNI